MGRESVATVAARALANARLRKMTRAEVLAMAARARAGKAKKRRKGRREAVPPQQTQITITKADFARTYDAHMKQLRERGVATKLQDYQGSLLFRPSGG